MRQSQNGKNLLTSNKTFSFQNESLYWWSIDIFPIDVMTALEDTFHGANDALKGFSFDI
jgi:hypothetical protein